MQDFSGLQVWKKAHALALKIYRVTGTDPGRNYLRLKGQSRCAAIAIAIAIAAKIAVRTAQESERVVRSVRPSAQRRLTAARCRSAGSHR
ncbi:MAG: four helix bundle protein [Gemmatimonadaceae bacterium]